MNRQWNRLVMGLVVVTGVAIVERVEGRDKGHAAVDGETTKD